MIFNKYSEVKEGNQTVIGAFKGSSSSSTSSRTPEKSVGLEREIWGQEDDGEDLNGDLTCEGNMYIVDNWDDGEEDDDTEEYVGSDAVEVPIMTMSIADDLSSKFDNDEGGNLYVKRQLKVEKNIESPEIYGHSMFVDFNNVKTNILDLLLPIGSIIMFNGKTAIPKGWAICNGSNGTPDLRGKFVKGGSATDVGTTGGNTTHTLTTNEMPSHNHSATTTVKLNATQGNTDMHTDWYDKFFIGYEETNYQAFSVGVDNHYTAETGFNTPKENGIVEVPIQDLLYALGSGSGSGSATATTTIGNTGSGAAFNIEPPYYTLIYIMKIS